MEGPRRAASVILPDDAGARRTRSIRGIPAENRKRGDEHLSLLRRVRGHGPAYAGVLSGVGGPRRMLRLAIGERLDPMSVMKTMLRGQQEFLTARSYCEGVMLVKKRTERERVRTSHPCRVPAPP